MKNNVQDMTEVLREKGLAWLEYRNKSLNVNVAIQLTSEDIRNKFKDDPSFKKLEESAMNHSERVLPLNETGITMHYVEDHYFYLTMTFAAVCITIGLIGLIIKLNNKKYNKVVRNIRSSSSVWLMVMGLLQVVTEGSYYQANGSLLHFSLANGFSLVVRVAVIAYKNFTLILYSFQNVMIYRPFYFREHKAGFGKWLIRSTMAQWVLTVTVFLSAALYLIYNEAAEGCEVVLKRAVVWGTSLLICTYTSFLISLLLSSVYVVGYYYKTREHLSSARRADLRNTLVTCAVEILFDVAVILYMGLVAGNCLIPQMNHSQPFYEVYSVACSGIAERLHYLEFGIGDCGVQILASQGLFQETASLILEVITWCFEKRIPLKNVACEK